LWLALRTDYRRLEKFVLPFLGLSVLLLVLVLLPGLGVSVNGSRRWLRLGPLSFQPAELAKLALVVYLAAFLARKRDELGEFWRGMVPPLAVGGTLAALVLAQPDLGSCLTLLVLTVGLLFLAGAPTRSLALLVGPALSLAALAVWLAPYRMRRVFAFLDPWQDPRGSGFQIIQSWLALGGGGLTGRGIGESKQKLFYLPEAHTDFIFAVLGEELGFLGAAAVVVLFAVLVWRGLRIGIRAADPFGAYLALGITVLVATQTLVNLGVVTGMLPTKGLPLPFLSFGGSALLMTMLATGMLLNISQDARV
jgi:cell division protein FtsW